jgi:hypothetical protein
VATQPAGEASLDFTQRPGEEGFATFAYTVDGQSGSKRITRLPYWPSPPTPLPPAGEGRKALPSPLGRGAGDGDKMRSLLPLGVGPGMRG